MLVEIARQHRLSLSDRGSSISVVRRPRVNRRRQQAFKRRIGRGLGVVRLVVLRRRLHLDVDSCNLVMVIVAPDAAVVPEIRALIGDLVVVRQGDGIGVRSFDRPGVGRCGGLDRLMGPPSMLHAPWLRLLGSLLRGSVSRCDQLSNPGVGRSAKLVVQDQHEREGRGDYCKIECQPPIAMRVRVVDARSVRARRSPRDSSPQCTDRSREPATRIGRGDCRRNPPPSVAAEPGCVTRNLRHA
jgi:hypothetical protein